MIRSRHPARTGDGGYAVVWTVTAMAVVIAATLVALGVGAATLARHRAAAAADAAALAAALRTVQGPHAACAAARGLAVRDGATLTGCAVEGAFVTTTVTVALSGPLRPFGPATGRARSGPASAASPP